MSKVVVQTFLTLDGVYQAPGDPNEDTEGGFTHGGWQVPYFDADAGKVMDSQMPELGALLLGRKTYQIFAAYWPTAQGDDAAAKIFNSIPKYVVSTTLKSADWNNSRLIQWNLAQGVNQAKTLVTTGIVSVIGSGKLVQSLMKEGLVDEYRLWIHPLVLGSGKRLFDGGVIPTNLKLVDTKTTGSGIVMLTLVPEKK
ncbi:MAG TPA: dihydrofolate reductase family protein [Anaerolineales bacterium]